MLDAKALLIVAALAVAPAGGLLAQTSALARDTMPDLRPERAFPRLVFRRPVFLTHAGDGTGRLFVIEQDGRIRVFENRYNVETAGVFLNLRKVVRRRHNEEGLLGLAFHPDYATNGRLYVCYSASDPRRDVLSEFTVDSEDPDKADRASERVIMEIPQPYGNHNGATVLFGPDGYLYLSFGDGGAANDPLGSGQDLSTLLGTILRIDVDRRDGKQPYAIPKDNPFVNRAGARPEIWAYGLRNPWRMAFDPVTGQLWAGDVGQNKWEEIDLIERGGNYGWNIREGAHSFKDAEPPNQDPLIDPVIEYPQRAGREIIGLSVTGGHVYRGSATPALYGAYVYGDYVTGRIWALRYDDGRVIMHREVYTPKPVIYIASFGEDEAGELYICGFDSADGRGGGTGRIYELTK